MRIALEIFALWSKLEKKIMFSGVKCPFYVDEFALVQCSFDVYQRYICKDWNLGDAKN